MDNEPVRKEKDENFKIPQLSKERAEGNIWGWRNSAIGGIIILIFMMIALIRYCQVKPDTFYVRDSQLIEKNK